MTKADLFAASAAALILAFAAGWSISDTQARAITPIPTIQIDPFHMMTSAKQLSAEHFVDYSFVFN
jgi:formylmethanofuran dehydrogenase subunit B